MAQFLLYLGGKFVHFFGVLENFMKKIYLSLILGVSLVALNPAHAFFGTPESKKALSNKAAAERLFRWMEDWTAEEEPNEIQRLAHSQAQLQPEAPVLEVDVLNKLIAS